MEGVWSYSVSDWSSAGVYSLPCISLQFVHFFISFFALHVVLSNTPTLAVKLPLFSFFFVYVYDMFFFSVLSLCI